MSGRLNTLNALTAGEVLVISTVAGNPPDDTSNVVVPTKDDGAEAATVIDELGETELVAVAAAVPAVGTFKLDGPVATDDGVVMGRGEDGSAAIFCTQTKKTNRRSLS